MVKTVPIVRRGREVSGAGGIGKVQIVYKPKKPKPYCLMFIGLIVYSAFLGIYFTSFFWSRPQIRGNFIIPIWKKMIFGGDNIRILMNSILRQESNIRPSDDHVLDASTEESAVYMQGYVHAKNRLFQMDVYRRMAFGTLTEVFGNKTLYLDNFSCTIDIKSAAYKALEELQDDPVMPLLQSYSRGVNDAIAQEFRGMYPIDFHYTYGMLNSIPLEPWQPIHSIAILQWFVYQHTHGWEDTLLATLIKKQLNSDENLIHELFGDLLNKLSPSHSLSKENSYGEDSDTMQIEALSGSFFAQTTTRNQATYTTIGVDFLGSMKSLGFWYDNHLKASTPTSSKFDVQGVSFPGIPFVLSGSSPQLTWSITQLPVPQQHHHLQNQITLITKEDIASGKFSKLDLQQRKEFIPLRELQEASDGQAPSTHRLLELDIHFSSLYGIDMFPSLAPEIKAMCLQLQVEHVFVQSPLFSSAISTQTLRFMHAINHATSASSLEELYTNQHKSIANLVPWQVLYADHQGDMGVLPRMTPKTVKTTSMVATADTHARKLLHQHIQQQPTQSDYNLNIFDNVFSPSGWDLSQQLLQLLRQHPLVVQAAAASKEKEAATQNQEDSLSRTEIRHQQDLLEIIKLLETFDGRYTPQAIAPSIIETFRMYFLGEATREILGPIATTVYGAYNITAISRFTELEIRGHASRLLAPYLADHSHHQPPHTNNTSQWVERAGGLSIVLQRSLDGALEWLYKLHENRPISTWEWQNIHHLLIHHPVSPAVTLLDSVLGAGPELIGGNFDSLLHSDYSSGELLYTHDMLHGIDTFRSAFRYVVQHQFGGSSSATNMDVHVFTRDYSVRHPVSRRSFASKIIFSDENGHKRTNSHATSSVSDEL